MSYELYSWQGANGEWNFRIMVSPSGVNISPEEVFNEKSVVKGTRELKHKISELPMRATIFWSDRMPGATNQRAKERAKLAYPPPSVIEEVRRFAGTRKIKVEMLSGKQSDRQAGGTG